jgi:hypothetical protein
VTGPYRPPLSLVPQEPDQVPRLSQFRRAHPGITIGAGHGYWQAQIPLLSGEQVITRYQLRDLLDKLDTLTNDPGPAGANPAPASPALGRRQVTAAGQTIPPPALDSLSRTSSGANGRHPPPPLAGSRARHPGPAPHQGGHFR